MKKKTFFSNIKNKYLALIMFKKQKPYKFWPLMIFCLGLITAIGWSAYNLQKDRAWGYKIDAAEEINFSGFKTMVENKQVKELNNITFVNERGTNVYYMTVNDKNYIYYPSDIHQLYRGTGTDKDDYIIHGMDDVKIHTINANNIVKVLGFWFSFFTMVGFLVLIVSAQFVVQEILTGKNFATKNINFDIHFDNIIGYQEVKDQFLEIRDFLKNKSYYLANNLQVPKGILLTGNPGVGKTMFAKALANEMKVAFFLASGSDFVELYVGLGARRVRELFKKARLSGKAVIFIDEIDALGSRTQAYMDSERLSTLNQLLAEMDGAEERGDIIVIGATNFPEKLDQALMRPGRFDRMINIPLPDLTTRVNLLKYYFGNHKISDDINLHQVAITLSGASGADIKKFVDTAKMKASKISKEGEPVLTKEVLSTVKEESLLGLIQNKIQNEEERVRVAYHELGHAFAIRKFLPESKVEKVSILPRGQALGVTINYPIEELRLHTRKRLLGQVAVLLGGRAAEELFTDDISNGAADDLNKASEIIKKMVNEWGLGERKQLLTYTQNNYQMPQPLENKEEITQMLQKQYQIVLTYLKEQEIHMHKGKDILLEKESIDEQELEKIFTS